MAERVQKVLGEGGAHLHRLESPVKTAEDGFHKHLFFVNDRLVMTDLSGAHTHPVDAKTSVVGVESAPHKHVVPINTQEGLVVFETDGGTGHAHELQSQTTTLSGLHTHILMLGDQAYMSLLPGDLIEAVDAATKQDPSLKNFKLKKSDSPLEMNFELVKRLNADDFKPVMKKAVVSAVVKAMSRLIDGLQVESLVLSRSRFFDVGVATRFVLDAGLGINGASESETEYVFNVRAKDKFDESSLQRVRLSDGVEAVVGLLRSETKSEDGTVEAGLPELTDRNKEGEAVGLKELQAKRATEFGIEALNLEDAALTPAAGTMWGDPVNFKFPLDDAKTVTAAVKNFGDNIGDYLNESSKKRVAERIAAAAVKASVAVANDSEIWNYLSQKTRELFLKPEPAPADSLKTKFSGFMSSIMEGEEPKAVAKAEGQPKKKGELVNWKTDKPISGTGAAKVLEIAKTLGVERKYVTVEAAQKRFIEFLMSKYEVKNAVYADSAAKDNKQTEEFLSFEIRGEGIDAVLFSEEISSSAWRKSLIIFFDDEAKLDEIFKTEIKNHSFGAYELKQSMMGPVLYPIEIDKETTPILDEELLKALETDTSLFFSKRVEDFFSGENPIKKKLPYKRGVMMYGPPGNGKCLARGTPVLMFDGSVRKVEEIKTGERLMGDDSTPRTVQSLARGRETMFRIVPTKGEPYVVNKSHILSLKMNGDAGGHKKDEVVDISVTDYLEKSNTFKHRAKGFRVGVNFQPAQEIYLDPYFLGLWLGDGNSDGPRITTPDEEVVFFMEEYAEQLGLNFKFVANCGEANTYGITVDRGSGGNKLLDAMRQHNLLNNKHIPEAFKTNSRDVRLKVLAGLIDSDGSVNCNCCDYITKHEKLADDIVYLSRSLGFAAYKKECQKGFTRDDGSKFDGTYYRIGISGDLSEVPTQIAHKQFEKRKQVKDVLVTGIHVEELEVDDYFGFEIDGNRRFLLGDFTVTHNTTFIKHFITHFEGSYSILVDARDFDSNIGKFLEQSLGRDAKKVIVFEDVDAIASRYEMRSCFLNFLDGAVGLHKTLIIATTNYPGMLDDALMKRPSRFDQKYKINLPNEGMRAKFLMHFFPDLSPSELQKHVAATDKFSGAYFKEIFILKGMRQCTVAKAIELVQASMTDVRKSEPDQEEIAWMLDDEMEIQDIARASMISKGLRQIAEDIAEAGDEAEPTEALKVSLFFDIAKADTEQRLVIGPVLVPENFDLQDDIISEEEIAKAAHNYLIKLNFAADPEFLKSLGLNEKSKRGFMHTEFNRKIALVESYIAPVDFTLNKREIKAGTWVMAVKVFDDEVWSLVKAKRITGFSIGGRSRSIPVEA